MINTVILCLLFAISVRGNFPIDDKFTIRFYVEGPSTDLPGGVSGDVVPPGLASKAGRRLNYIAQATPTADGERVLIGYSDGHANTPPPVEILTAAQTNKLLLVTAKSQNGLGKHVYNEFPVDIIFHEHEYYAVDKS